MTNTPGIREPFFSGPWDEYWTEKYRFAPHSHKNIYSDVNRRNCPTGRNSPSAPCILLSLSNSIIPNTKDSLSQSFAVACHAWPSVFYLLLSLPLEKLKRKVIVFLPSQSLFMLSTLTGAGQRRWNSFSIDCFLNLRSPHRTYVIYQM